MSRSRIESIAFLVLFAWVAWLAWGMFSIFFSPLVMAVVLAILFNPLYVRLRKIFRGQSTIAATVVVGVVLLFVVVPIGCPSTRAPCCSHSNPIAVIPLRPVKTNAGTGRHQVLGRHP